ncbi:MAG TPA: T9SS type A sorting domain-containing protein, partial [Bacteroidales bacterium]|nr:T9SS type A sorting domain-containing protein [Bacteroidales bacterium]
NALNTQKLIIDNPAGVQMDAITNISYELIFMNGILNLSENSMVKMGLNAITTGFDADKYINGQLAIKTNNEQSLELFFPVGTTSLYAPFIFEPEHGNTNETEYIGRAIDFDPMGYVLDEELGSLIENNLHQLSFSGNPDILESKIKILFNEETAKLNPGLLRIAKFENDMWISLGGLVEGNKICSTEEFTLPGVFALAKAKTELPETLLLQGLTFGNTTDTCFAATKTIILAGNGTSFIVENEAMVNIVAGENIIFNPEVQINHGAMFHAWIDTTNEYCGQEKSIIAVNNNDRESTTSIKNKDDNARLFNVYPNPTNGNLTIVSLSGNESCFLEVYNFTGEKLLSRNISGSSNYTLNLSDYPEGMYLLRLFAGSNFEIMKIVKL